MLLHLSDEELSMADLATKLGLANADTVKSAKCKCKYALRSIIETKYGISDIL